MDHDKLEDLMRNPGEQMTIWHDLIGAGNYNGQLSVGVGRTATGEGKIDVYIQGDGGWVPESLVIEGETVEVEAHPYSLPIVAL